MAKTEKENTQALVVTLKKWEPKIKALVPKHVDPSGLMRVVYTACTMTPKLLECSPISIVRATVQSAMLGLVPNDGRGLSYLVPFGGVATFVVGYRGLQALAYQSTEVKGIRAREVYEGDEWEFSDGIPQILRHKPSPAAAFGPAGEELRPLVAVYALANIRGEWLPEVMMRWEVDRIRDRTQAWQAFKRGAIKETPWNSDYGMMARKTAIKRGARYWPVATERMSPLGRAIQLDDQADIGEAQIFDERILEEIPEEREPEPEPAPKSTTDLAAKRNGNAASAPTGGGGGSGTGAVLLIACGAPGCNDKLSAEHIEAHRKQHAPQCNGNAKEHAGSPCAAANCYLVESPPR